MCSSKDYLGNYVAVISYYILTYQDICYSTIALSTIISFFFSFVTVYQCWKVCANFKSADTLQGCKVS